MYTSTNLCSLILKRAAYFQYVLFIHYYTRSCTDVYAHRKANANCACRNTRSYNWHIPSPAWFFGLSILTGAQISFKYYNIYGLTHCTLPKYDSLHKSSQIYQLVEFHILRSDKRQYIDLNDTKMRRYALQSILYPVRDWIIYNLGSELDKLFGTLYKFRISSVKEGDTEERKYLWAIKSCRRYIGQ